MGIIQLKTSLKIRVETKPELESHPVVLYVKELLATITQPLTGIIETAVLSMAVEGTPPRLVALELEKLTQLILLAIKQQNPAPEFKNAEELAVEIKKAEN